MSIKTTLGIIGLGTVGTGVVNLLRDNPQFDIRGIAVAHLDKPREVDLQQLALTNDPFKLADDPEIEVIVEVVGGVDPMYEVVKRALTNGKHLVTANKELIAKHGPELFALANAHNVTIFFEAAVGGGIPLISTLQRGLQANRIARVAGIINGTTNYILTKMELEKKPFAEALSEAQAAGFAETDPTNDIEGFDVVYKIAILSSLAFQTPVEVGQIYRQGITAISDLDIQLANEFGYRIKMIGLAQPGNDEQPETNFPQRLDVRAHPMLVPQHHPLAGVEGVNNAIFISGSAVGEIMLFGPGAGRYPTASAVVGDVINLASAIKLPDFARYFQSSIRSQASEVFPIAETVNGYYIRLETRDSPGVIGHLGQAFGNHGVSLHSFTQKGVTEDGTATIVLLTHRVREQQLQDALREIEAQPTTKQVAIVLRVLN
ncbi:MAG: homoserine dehydrogenase [Acidobacteria bacterium]|nr:homoserine dehydrogenase [Acidobacteriota bacterium]MBI3425978.1 homoserine dehydrogenase [Acidobacteriota bacterium]